MIPLWFILAITGVHTLGEVMGGRGLFFFTRDVLHYSDAQNLALVIVAAFCAACASLLGHWPAARLGPRRWLMVALLLRVSGDSVLLLQPTGPWVVLGAMLRWSGGGAFWPVVQSYLTAGRSLEQTSRAVGWFNVAWALAIPVGLMPAGWIIAHDPRGLFVLGLGFHTLTFLLALGLPAAPAHGLAGATAALSDAEARWLTPLLISARWANFSASLLLNLLIAVMPGVMMRLGESVETATLWASVTDWARLAAFLVMTLAIGWHGQRRVLVGVALALPASIFMILLGNDLAWVVAGQLLYGLAGGAAYTVSLYYGMVLQNASVKSAGRHEGLGSLGGSIGPAAGLLCEKLAVPLGATLGTLAGMAPALVVCAGGTLWPLWRRRGLSRDASRS